MPIQAWRLFAFGSAFFAALTAVLGKVAVTSINSNLATFLRTLVVLAFAGALLYWRDEWRPLASLDGKALAFIVLSGLATGASWLCYYHALQLGPVAKVAPIDKLSVAIAILLAVIFLGERLDLKAALGCALVVAGSVVLAW